MQALEEQQLHSALAAQLQQEVEKQTAHAEDKVQLEQRLAAAKQVCAVGTGSLPLMSDLSCGNDFSFSIFGTGVVVAVGCVCVFKFGFALSIYR